MQINHVIKHRLTAFVFLSIFQNHKQQKVKEETKIRFRTVMRLTCYIPTFEANLQGYRRGRASEHRPTKPS